MSYERFLKALIVISILLFCYNMFINKEWNRRKVSSPLPIPWNTKDQLITLWNVDDIVSQEVFDGLLSKNISNFSATDWQNFMAYKERQYMERRQSVLQYCETQKAGFSTKIQGNKYIIDIQHMVAYCKIPKVASSSFAEHFRTIANVTVLGLNETSWQYALNILTTKHWPELKGTNPTSVWPYLTSLVIVRHPLARLSSLYYSKITTRNENWASINRNAVEKYRDDSVNTNSRHASPSQFIHFILDDFISEQNGVTLNHRGHWKPQHLSCPFCGLEFTVYARLEELDQDKAYFFQRANLTNIVNTNLHKNKKTSLVKEVEFWSNVDPELIMLVLSAYKIDFEMFGYSVQQYFGRLNLNIDIKD